MKIDQAPKNEKNKVFYMTFVKAVYCSSLKEAKIGLERPVEESDFAEEKIEIENNLRLINEFLVSSYNSTDEKDEFKNFNKDFKMKTVITILLLCGEHTRVTDVWTTPNTIDLSKQIMDILCKHYSCANVKQLIVTNNFAPLMFNALQRKLLKDAWKCYPAAVCCYMWILMQTQSPDVAKVLHMIMPTTLLLLDDYIISNRILGLTCLQHIIENITRTELSWYCEGSILYKTLLPMVYSLECGLVKPLITCLIAVIGKIVPNEDKLKWTYYDDILNVWLASIEMEQKLMLRKEYMESLAVFIESMGLSSVRWSIRLLRIFEMYAAVPNDRGNCFKTLHTFIRMSWPRARSNFQRLSTIILKSMSDLIDDKECLMSEVDRRNDVNAIVACLVLLRQIVPDKMNRLCRDVNSNDRLSQEFKEYFKN